MIGWKIVCNFGDKDIVCEVVGMPMVAGDNIDLFVPVYHDKVIKIAGFGINQEIKVIERK